MALVQVTPNFIIAYQRIHFAIFVFVCIQKAREEVISAVLAYCRQQVHGRVSRIGDGSSLAVLRPHNNGYHDWVGGYQMGLHGQIESVGRFCKSRTKKSTQSVKVMAPLKRSYNSMNSYYAKYKFTK